MDDDHKKVYRISWQLFSEWYHADKDATEEEILDVVMDSNDVQATREQVRQRLFGGFFCADDPDAIHIMHYAGGYTYTGVNSDFLPEDRSKIWATLMEHNHEKMTLGSLFMEDYPGGNNDV